MFLWQVAFWLAKNLLLTLHGNRAVYFIRHRKSIIVLTYCLCCVFQRHIMEYTWHILRESIMCSTNVLKDITDRSYENTESAKDGIPQHFFFEKSIKCLRNRLVSFIFVPFTKWPCVRWTMRKLYPGQYENMILLSIVISSNDVIQS
jgi:hypothetical protein